MKFQRPFKLTLNLYPDNQQMRLQAVKVSTTGQLVYSVSIGQTTIYRFHILAGVYLQW